MAGLLRGVTKETLQCVIAPEVTFVPPGYDINRRPLLHYRMKDRPDKTGKLEESDDNSSDDESSSLISR